MSGSVALAHGGRTLRDEHWELATRAWPDIELSRPTLEEAASQKSEEPTGDGWAELYLACACAAGDRRALESFDQHYLCVVPEATRHMNLSPDLVDEVAQRVREKLLVADQGEPPRVVDYAGQGTLRGLIQVMSVRTAISLLRSSKAKKAADPDVLIKLPSLEFDPELQVMKKHYRHTFAQAFEETVAALASRDRNVLRLHLIDGLTVEQVGGMYGVHRATATRWLAKIRSDLLKGTRKRMKVELQIGNTELESVMRLIESRLDVSVQRMLQTSDH